MKKVLITALKAGIFFVGWAVCVGLCPVPSGDPVRWRLWAEALPLAIMLAFSVVFWLIEKRRIRIVSFENPVRNLCVGVGAGALWLGLAVGILYGIGVLSFEGSTPVANLPLWLLACLLNVIMQELLVRGYLYQLIKRQHSVAAAMVVTTLLFTALHGGALEAGAVAVLNVATMSVFMSLLLEYTGSLVAPILVHAVWNGVGAILLGGVSLAEDYPQLLQTVFRGNALLSGGRCKLEGSVVVLLLNVLFSCALLALRKRAKAGAARAD